jgi:GDP-4-dehydro-6-deoxy-D-mannose reductase
VAGAVLVTGAAGFAGSHLVEHLSRDSGELVAWARSAPPPELAALARWDIVDLLDRERVRRSIAELKPSRIYHCGGAAHVAESWARVAATLETNVLATHYLFDAVRRAGVECRVLVPGSAHVYAPSGTPIPEDAPVAPASPYALSKLAQEQLGSRAVVEDAVVTILPRVFNHTGPRQSAAFAAASFARQIASIERGAAEPVMKVGNLAAQRDLTDVRDTVRAYTLLMERGAAGTVYNVASGVARSTQVVLDALLARARTAIRVEVDPARMRPNDIPVLVGDPTRLREATGWTPRISFDQMMSDLLEYWRNTSPAAGSRQ